MAPSWRAFFRHSHAANKRTSFLRHLFPNVAQRTKDQLWDFRYFYLPALKQRAQSRIHRYIIARQFRKQNPQASGVFASLRRHGLPFPRPTLPKDGAPARRSNKMAYTGPGNALAYGDYATMRAEAREPGYKRKKLAGLLKAANEVRQSYFTGEGGSGRDGSGESGADEPGAFPDAAVVRSGNEEMILFPSYARRHVKSKVRLHA